MTKLCVLLALCCVCMLALGPMLTNACKRPDSHRPTYEDGRYGWQWSWDFRKRRSTDDAKNGALMTRICDGDGDGKVSKQEFKSCFFLPTRLANEKINYLDKNGDGSLSADELDELGFDNSGAGNCYQEMLMQCGMEFLMYSRVRASDEDTMCKASQVYVNCAVRYNSTCELPIFVSFKHALKDMIASAQADGVCPDVDFSLLGNGASYATMSCSKNAIVGCDVMFLEDLRDGQDPCGSLSEYETCLSDMTESCDDDPARYARAGSHTLVTAYMGNQMCK